LYICKKIKRWKDTLKELMKAKYGESEKNTKTTKSTKRAVDKTKSSSNGKYVTKIVDGVKYMVLK
jgi:phosphomannomutase